MSASSIEWTDATWNPVTGCSRVSPGCANCYIERTPPFRMAHRRFERIDGESTTGVKLIPGRLDEPLRWRKPRRVFVCSLADLFHDEIPDHFIAGVFAIMSQARRHTFQVLTKRPERARDLLCRWRDVVGLRVALPNVWLGVSIENARYTWRADVVRQIPAAVRFISAEPLLGSLFDVRARGVERSESPALGPPVIHHAKPLDLTAIDWVIIGGESGPGARPFHLAHAREIVSACKNHADQPAVFVKQLGTKPLGRGYVNRSENGPPFHLQMLSDVPMKLRDSKGGDIDEWPADLQIREFPAPSRRGAAAVPA